MKNLNAVLGNTINNNIWSKELDKIKHASYSNVKDFINIRFDNLILDTSDSLENEINKTKN
jgi:hypothetical protein